jgi:hypothetical protein
MYKNELSRQQNNLQISSDVRPGQATSSLPIGGNCAVYRKSLVHMEDTLPVDHPTPCRGRTPRQSIAAQSSEQMIEDVDAVGSSSTDIDHSINAP